MNEKHQCRYCEAEQHVRTEFCTKTEKTGAVCLAPGFQTLGNAYTKGPYGYFFNANKLCSSKFKTISCEGCHQIELEVLKTLPGKQSLYVYNNDGNINSQRLNDGVVDGTSQVVRFGWPAWRERLHNLQNRYAAMADDRSHSGLTDPEDESDRDSVTLNEGVTPPSPPASPKSPLEQRTRADLIGMQIKIRNKLNDDRTRLHPELTRLNPTEAMIQWGDAHPILRVKPKSSSIGKIRLAMRDVNDGWGVNGEITATQEDSLLSVADRHEMWASWAAKRHAGKEGPPPGPERGHENVDRVYRKKYGLTI
jgi:hypothetical protein